ncbi:MAG: tRNA uridine-5-carboxymethylaminomethyl(34) synthesis GTPase MnmE [Polynucleobacter sp.]|jgi:tRNA modification GTPase|nr:tRNA uridine-5-carboxymethylaminomethyl(34) synthesis GTPase MnmE [Polynucleobacter sp.]
MLTRKIPIIAIATAAGGAGVGIVRISGAPIQAELVHAIVGREMPARQAVVVSLKNAAGETIDQALALFFPEPASFTGEDVLELQCHGGPQLLQMVVRRCLELGKKSGLAIAEPGEFTQRAYLNGKIDLVQAEAIADLISAQSEAAVLGATRSLQGTFSQAINALVEEITQLRILVESTLDFPEEEIDFLESAQAHQRLLTISQRLVGLQEAATQGAILRDGMQLVLVGAPNVGKSSLLNRLAGDDVAIVTDLAGTTRDRIKVTITLAGIPVHVIDTAGLRVTHDPLERAGIERTWEAIRHADVMLFLRDGSEQNQAMSQEEVEMQNRIKTALPRHAIFFEVINKADLCSKLQIQASQLLGSLCVSAKTGLGIDELIKRIVERPGWNGGNEDLLIARQRHLECIASSATHLQKAQIHSLNGNQTLELFAEELRLAQACLEQVLGRTLPDELLGKIFSQFCIGK